MCTAALGRQEDKRAWSAIGRLRARGQDKIKTRSAVHAAVQMAYPSDPAASSYSLVHAYENKGQKDACITGDTTTSGALAIASPSGNDDGRGHGAAGKMISRMTS